MRLMFDIEFNMGLLLLGVMLTAVITYAIQHEFTPKRPMRPPDAVINLSDTESETSETSSGETIGEDQVDGIYKDQKDQSTNINKG